MRVALLIAIAAALTWYSRQNRNNPFADEEHLIIAGDSACSFIRCVTRNAPQKDQALLLISLRNDNATAWQKLFLDNWSLLTLDIPAQLSAPHDTIPAAWIIIGVSEIADSLLPAGRDNWPQPEPARDAAQVGGAHFNFIKAFASQQPILAISYGEMKLAVIKAEWYPPDSIEQSPYKEEFDIVAAIDLNHAQLQRLRTLLRPRYIIALAMQPHAAHASESQDNILHASPAGFSFDFSRNARHKLRLE